MTSIQQQSFSILRKTSSIWQLFPHNLGDGNQLFQIKFISLVLQPLYLPGSFLFKFYFTLTKLARNFQILHRKQSKICNARKKQFFIFKLASVSFLAILTFCISTTISFDSQNVRIANTLGTNIKKIK